MPIEKTYLVLDLETVIDVDNPPPPAPEGKEAPFPAPSHHRIVCAGFGVLKPTKQDGTPGDIYFQAVTHAHETRMMAQVVDILSGSDKSRTVVTWNGRGFDLPVIVHRCLKLGVPFPAYWMNRGMRYRYSIEGHWDLMDDLNDYGAARHGMAFV